MISYELSKSPETLKQILELQYKNLEVQISADELKNEGFVTVHHDYDLLETICGEYGHMVANDQGKVIAYALVMLKEYGKSVPVLVPMFDLINQLTYETLALKDSPYLVMGQVCVDKAYRGQGIFYELYQQMRLNLSSSFDYIITEVATRNPRSIKAHAKLGFECIHNYVADEEDWDIILWNWKAQKSQI